MNMKSKEAVVIIAKCKESKKAYGIRVEKRGNDWYRTWAFKIGEKSAKREGFDKTVINGRFQADIEYNGCPHCGTKEFTRCSCGKISCWNGERIVKCNWCGGTGEIAMVKSMAVGGVNF